MTPSAMHLLFIGTVEKRQGLKVACVEAAAYRTDYIDKDLLRSLAMSFKSYYGHYLLRLTHPETKLI